MAVTSRSTLGGRVQIQSLVCVEQPAGRSEARARIITPGGELAVLTDGKSPILHLAYVELRTGKVRGNHFHKQRHESFYLIAGEVELYLKDLSTGEEARTVLRAGDLSMVEPEIVHAFSPLSSGHGVEFAPEAFD